MNQPDPTLLNAQKTSPPPSAILRTACRLPPFAASGVGIRCPPRCRPRIAVVLPLCAVVTPPPLPPHIAAAPPLSPRTYCARPRAVTSLTPSLRRHPLTVPSRRYIPAPLLAPKTLLVPPPLPSSICLLIFNLQGSNGPGGQAAARGEGETHPTSALPARCSAKCLTDIRNSRMFKYK
jgi:hypothetical protein